MTNISVLPLTQKAPFTKGCLLAVNGYLLATFNISDSGETGIYPPTILNWWWYWRLGGGGQGQGHIHGGGGEQC